MRQCGYCGFSGHNRRTCAKLKKYISDNPDSYAARAEADRVSARPVKRASTRRCSFCHEVGHTKRTCAVRSNKIEEQIESNRHFRNLLRRRLAKSGWFPGALIKFDVLRISDDPLSTTETMGREFGAWKTQFGVGCPKTRTNGFTAMVCGYLSEKMNGGDGQYLWSCEMIKLRTASGRLIRTPLPNDVIIGMGHPRPKGDGRRWRAPWNFVDAKVAGSAGVNAPNRFLCDHFGEEFLSGETGAVDIVDAISAGYDVT
jgi:hypothetical protein